MPSAASDRDAPPNPPVTYGWESERDTERSKVNARWFATLILFAVAEWIRRHDPMVEAQLTNRILYSCTVAAFLMTAIEAAYLWHPSVTEIPRWLKYVTVVGDMTFISALIYYTGFNQSPFFFVYFVFLISNCLRYGLVMSLFVAGVFNLFYVFVLGLAPKEELKPSVLGGEGLKILAFWLTAFYGGTISARLRRQAAQLRVYEETIGELRAELKARTSETPAEESP
jgi:hypothetical protein